MVSAGEQGSEVKVENLLGHCWKSQEGKLCAFLKMSTKQNNLKKSCSERQWLKGEFENSVNFAHFGRFFFFLETWSFKLATILLPQQPPSQMLELQVEPLCPYNNVDFRCRPPLLSTEFIFGNCFEFKEWSSLDAVSLHTPDADSSLLAWWVALLW